MFAALFGCVLVAGLAGPAASEPVLHVPFAAGRSSAARLGESTLTSRSSQDVAAGSLAPSVPAPYARFDGHNAGAPPPPVGGYDPAGRRDPFAPVLSQLAPGQVDPTLPPLQRVGLTDLNLIAIVWGAYGYTAMVQTPDGNGYTVRKGTRVGPNSRRGERNDRKRHYRQERFTDVYGRKQEREYVKLLHPKEGLE